MTKNPESELLPNAIRRRAPLRRGQELSVKRHCEGALRQVVGYFENMAEKDPTGKRFVFAGWEAALRGINKRHKMGRRTYFDAQAVARAQHIISEPLLRVRDGKKYVGVIVTHPAALCVREGNQSVFKGKLPEPPIGRWREENGVTFWHGRGNPFGVNRTNVAPEPHQHCTDAAPPPHQSCTDAALETSKSRTDFRTDIVSSKVSEAVPVNSDVADGCTDSSVRKSVPDTTPSRDILQSKMPPYTLESVESLETLETSKTNETVETHGQEKRNGNPEHREGGSSLLSGLTDQNLKPPPIKSGPTIGAAMSLAGDILSAISDGELPDDVLAGWSSKDSSRLRACAEQRVADKADLPFCGRETCAQLMGDTMRLLRERHSLNAPKPWVPIIKSLRSSRGPSRIQRDAAEESNLQDSLRRDAGWVEKDGRWFKPDGTEVKL